MAGQAIQVSLKGQQKAQAALTDKCLTKKELAKKLNISRQTVSQFFQGQPVELPFFVKICKDLRLEWDNIAANPTMTPVQDKRQLNCASYIEELVREVRQLCHYKIQHQCSTIRMLNISQPVKITSFYTDVNILEEITSQQYFNSSDDFERLARDVNQKAVPGLDAVSRHSKLMILGKPGAGKTTFLQWVATKCNEGEFQSHRVPIFILLRNFAEDTKTDNSEFKLFNYISQEFFCCGISDLTIEAILTQGRGLILLDGLDEVSEQDNNEVVNQISRFVNKYCLNQYIITSRQGKRKHRFHGEKFTQVEVADFYQEQVEAFAKKWFVAATKSKYMGETKALQFIEELLQENQQIRELAVTPILLNLTCLVFHFKGELPSKRFKLYEQGLDIILRKSNDKSGNQNEDHNLSSDRSQELLSQIAAITTDKSLYFFAQGEVEQYIADYLCSLPQAQTNRAILQQDSKVIMKSIEAQHGLLVERGRGIYSFSHLTFQEYFAALAVVNSFDSLDLKKSISRMSIPSWREVFVQAAVMMQPANELLLSMKRKIDELLTQEEQLQQLLFWAMKYSCSPELVYKRASCSSSQPMILRAFHLELALDIETLDRDRGHNLISQVFALTSSVALDFACTRDLIRAFSRVISCAHSGNPEVFFEMDIVLHLIRDRSDEIQETFQKLKRQLPDPDFDGLVFQQWWHVNGEDWIQQLRAVMIQYWNIGHDWQFNLHQKELLKQYYNANKLLVDCLNSGCEVSPEVRQEIEESLLLPQSLN